MLMNIFKLVFCRAIFIGLYSFTNLCFHHEAALYMYWLFIAEVRMEFTNYSVRRNVEEILSIVWEMLELFCLYISWPTWRALLRILLLQGTADGYEIPMDIPLRYTMLASKLMTRSLANICGRSISTAKFIN